MKIFVYGTSLLFMLTLNMTIPVAAKATSNNSLLNGSFEEPRESPGQADFIQLDASQVPGWQTTASDNRIELWTDGFGFPPYEGFQYAEINATQSATLFQDTNIANGETICFQFAHRARNVGPETLRLTITDLGQDSIFGTSDDTSLFSNLYSSNNSVWAVYNSAAASPITALGNTVRLSFESLEPGNAGNLIDAVTFGSQCSTLLFDGIDDYVEVADIAQINAIGTGDFTLEAWVQAEESVQLAHPTILSNRANTSTGFVFFFHAIWNGSPNKIPAIQLDGVNYVYTTPTPPDLLDGRWHHFAATKAGDTLTYYHDGVPGQSFTSPNIQAASLTSPHALWFGLDDQHSSTAFEGKLDDVRIWSKARTGAEILSTMNSLLTGTEPGLIAYWPLDEGTGQVAGDIVFGQDGRLGSTPGSDSQDPLWMQVATCPGHCPGPDCPPPRVPRPFGCINGQPFVSQAISTQAGEVDLWTGSFTVSPIGGPAGIEYNNLGFRAQDGLLYAVELNPSGSTQVVQIDADGIVFPLGPLPGMDSSKRYDAGDVSADGAWLKATVSNQPHVIDHIALNGQPLGWNVLSSGATGLVADWAQHPDDGNLYGCDSSDGQIAVQGATRNDVYPLFAGGPMPTGIPYGAAWFEEGRLFCYRNNGEIYAFTVSPTFAANVGFWAGPSASRNDGASCLQKLLGAAKQMTPPSPRTGLPETITIDYVFENLSAVEDLFDLSASDDLEAVFGASGTHWNLLSILSTPPGFENPSFDGQTTGDTELLASAVTLPTGSLITITVEIEVLSLDEVDPNGDFCNQVLALGETAAGLLVGDLSTAGLDPDPNGDGRPDENDPTCLNLGQLPIPCTDDVFMVQNVNAQLVRIDPTASTFLFTSIGAPAGREYNNLGYRRTDGLLYAVELTSTGNNGIVQIDATGKAFPPIQALGLPNNVRFDAGDVSTDGRWMYVTATNKPLYKVDLQSPQLVTTSVPITGAKGLVFDWAFSPADGNLYGGDSTHGHLAVLNPKDGKRTDHAIGLPVGIAYGGAWFDGGRLFLYRNNGEIYEIDLTTLSIVGFQSGPGSTRNDAASCSEICDGIDNDADGEIDEGFDLDGDGVARCCTPDPLFITLDQTFHRIHGFMSDGGGNFTPALTPIAELASEELRFNALGDFDADGKFDVVWRGLVSNDRFLTECSGGEWQTSPVGQWTYSYLGGADVDGDGNTDLLGWDMSCCQMSGPVLGTGLPALGLTAVGNGAGGFNELYGTFDPSPVLGAWIAQRTYNLADATGDGCLDTMFLEYSSGGASTSEIYLAEGDCTGGFLPPNLVGTIPGQPQNFGDMGDIDGDSCSDWIGGSDDDGDKGLVYAMLGDCAGSFSPPFTLVDSCVGCPGSGTGHGSGASQLYDWNGDGHLDLLTSLTLNTGATATVLYWENDGSGNFSGPTTVVAPTDLRSAAFATPLRN